MTPAARLALRGLHDCAVIRASVNHPGYPALAEARDADWEPVPGRPGMFDFRLTARGRELARATFEEPS